MSGLQKWYEKDRWELRVFGSGKVPATDIIVEVFDGRAVLTLRKLERTANKDGYYDDAPEVVVAEVEVELTYSEAQRLAAVLGSLPLPDYDD